MIKIDGGSTAQYGYGPQGERVWKITGGTTTYFYWGIGEKVSGQWTKLYVQGLGGKLVEYSGGTTWFFATNHLGTIAARMNVSGTLMETYRYLPYGERYAGTQTPHQYTGKERDAESGLDYFGARYLASAHGRWMGLDPSLGYSSNNPQRLNLYSFVLNDPINKVDRGGRSEEHWAGWELPGWEFQGCHWEEVLDRSSAGIFVCTYGRGASRLGETRQAQETRGGGGTQAPMVGAIGAAVDRTLQLLLTNETCRNALGGNDARTQLAQAWKDHRIVRKDLGKPSISNYAVIDAYSTDYGNGYIIEINTSGAFFEPHHVVTVEGNVVDHLLTLVQISDSGLSG